MPEYFTVAEANAVLPHLAPLLEEAQELQRQAGSLRAEAEGMAPQPRTNGHSQTAPQLLETNRRLWRLHRRMRDLLQRIDSWGVEIKDLDSGLVDFLSIRDGREVYLCWQLGEDSVEYWHETDTGFRGRQPL